MLRHDGRLSIPALAERVGISRATAYSRFDRLVADGVISGFRAEVDPHRRGLSVAASSGSAWPLRRSTSWRWCALRTSQNCATWS